MYTFSRRAKVSLIIPVIFLISAILNLINQNRLYTMAVKVGRVASVSPINLNTFYIFLLALLGLYILSTLFFSLESLIRLYITDKDSPQNQLKALEIKRASFRNKLKMLISFEYEEGIGKVTHSVLFQIVLVVLCFFASTSSSSVLGRGLTLSVLFQILIDQAILLKNDKNLNSWFWQIKANIPFEIQQIYFGIMAILTLLCIYFSIRPNF